MLKTTLRYVAFVAFLVAAAWVYAEPKKYDSWVAAGAAVVVFLGLLVPSSKRPPTQSQDVRSGGSGIQAGRDVKINVDGKEER